MLPLKALGKNLSLPFPGPWWLSAIPGVPWLVTTSLWSLTLVICPSFLCAFCVWVPFSPGWQWPFCYKILKNLVHFLCSEWGGSHQMRAFHKSFLDKPVFILGFFWDDQFNSLITSLFFPKKRFSSYTLWDWEFNLCCNLATCRMSLWVWFSEISAA